MLTHKEQIASTITDAKIMIFFAQYKITTSFLVNSFAILAVLYTFALYF